MKGKCFRCASGDHFTNNCSLAKDIKCKRCSTTRHIAAACTQGGVARSNATGEQEERKTPVFFALEGFWGQPQGPNFPSP